MQRGLLLDRDGVINVEKGFVGTRDRFSFMPGLFSFLRGARDLGYRLAIVSNQSGVARGFYTEQDYERLTTWMLSALAQEGIVVDLALACFDLKDAPLQAYNRDSYWRKPNPGMLLEAALKLRLSLSASAMLGDKWSDMQAACAAGVRHCLLLDAAWQASAPDALALQGVLRIANFAQALARLAEG